MPTKPTTRTKAGKKRINAIAIAIEKVELNPFSK
jgi:hypothetical protein